MDKTKAINDIEESRNFIKGNPSVKLYVISKHGKHVEFSFAEIDHDIKQSFLDRWINDYDRNNELTKYQVAMDKTDYTLFCQTNDYSGINKYIEKMDEDNDPKQYVDNLEMVKKHLNWVKGYCAKIYTENHTLYLFGSTGTFNALRKKPGIIANVSNHRITKLDPDAALVGFNANTVCFVYGETCIINNKKRFEDMFGLLSEYKAKALEAVQLFQLNSDFYQNLDTLADDLEKKPILYRSLVNIAKRPEVVTKITDHLDEIKKIKDDLEFKEKYKDLQINNQGIVYSPEALPQFLNLVNEKPVQSLVTGDKFSANREPE